MKVKVDIFTGSLGSGKTSLINEILGSSLTNKEKVLVIQCGTGKAEINESLLKDDLVLVEKIEKGTPLTGKMIREKIRRFFPDRMIIEHHGMAGLTNLLFELNQTGIRNLCRINSIMYIADARSWKTLVKSMRSIVAGQVRKSDLVVFNFSAGLSPEQIKDFKRIVKTMNPSAEVLTIIDPKEFRRNLDQGMIYQEEKPVRFGKWTNKFWGFLFLGILGYLLFITFKTKGGDVSGIGLNLIQPFNTVFISILMQAFPFLLIGVFLSSLIQFYVSGDRIAQFFSKNKALSFLVAIFGGVFIPVCDCAIIPIAVRLIKKGVPLPAALTFLLAAPTVNPIVVASTYYAFPNQPEIVFYRLLLGISLALLVGLAFMFFPRSEKIILDRVENYLCGCGHYHEDSLKEKGFFTKVTVIFQHAGAEFIDVGRFLIMGAFITAVVQMGVSKEYLFQLTGTGELSLVVMMAAAFLFSVCSTSDAFIGRSFSNVFPVGAVMGFLVIGPMIDLKNLLVLLGNFRKGFVFRLVFLIFALAYSLLYLFYFI